MIGRVLVLIGGLAGATSFSQFPEFSQQYVQRLGGAVDALSEVVAAFDRDAAREGLSRSEALVDLAQAGGFGARRAETMAATITRRDRLADDLAALREIGPFTRASVATRFTDSEIARRTWDDFRPALPLTFEGAVFGGAGFLAGAGLLSVLSWLLRLLFVRRRAA